jgi:hypothetical protein
MINVGAHVAVGLSLKKKRTRFINPKPTAENKCMRCTHVGQETTDDVACCNCCDDGEFFDPVEEEVEDRYTLDDLGPNWW